MFPKILITVLFLFVIGILPVHGALGDVKNEITIISTSNTNVANGVNYTITCPTGYIINKIGIWTRSGSGSVSMALYFPGFTTASSGITTTQAWSYFNLNGMACNETTPIVFTINTNGSYYSYNAPNTATTTNIKVQKQSDSLIIRYYLDLSLPLTSGSGNGTSSSNVATTTVLTQNDSLISFALLYFVFVLTLVLFVGFAYPLYQSKNARK